MDAIMTGSRPAYHPEAATASRPCFTWATLPAAQEKSIWDPTSEAFKQDDKELMADKVYDREERWQNG